MNNFKKRINYILGIMLILTAVSGCKSSITLPAQNLISSQQNSQVQSASVSEDVWNSTVRYKVIEIRGIDTVYEKKLNDVGIKYTDQLLEATAKKLQRESLAKKIGISEKLLLTWANHIDLMRIKGIGPKYSNWLEAVGVDTIPELRLRNAQNLYEKLEFANNIDSNRKFVKQMPPISVIEKWIALAKTTDPKVVLTY